MIFIGMIYQYDSEQGTGLLMLTDGEKREFSINDWVDSANQPGMGQKISYEMDANRVKIKVATEEDIERASAQQEEVVEEEIVSSEGMKQFSSLDESLEYFNGMGFKQIKDIPSENSRVLTLRKYTPSEYGEAIITERDSKITVELTLNGKPATIG
ncbi:MAG: hypothetical protein ABFQ64_06090 [Campylobacterota bacterium]